MSSLDIRWIQRFSNFQKAFANLTEAIELSSLRELSKLEKQGLIQSFEFTYELAWKTVKDFFESRGEIDILGSKDAFRLAFERGIITDGEVFMDAIKSRQLTSHTYNQITADEIYFDIIDKYYDAFLALNERLLIEQQKEKP